MTNHEQPNYRQQIAAELKAGSKESRPASLDEAQDNPQYWQDRGEKINRLEEEESTDDGMGVLLRKKTLYHGSATSDIESFAQAEETTVGNGIYCTSEAKDAIGYAQRRARSRKDTIPFIYEGSAENVKMLDLRKDENVQSILPGFKIILEDKAREPDQPWHRLEILQRAIKAINEGKVGRNNLREITFGTGSIFTTYIESLGYDGLIAFEGGEGEDVGDHDTYLVFDPAKVKIGRSHRIAHDEKRSENTIR